MKARVLQAPFNKMKVVNHYVALRHLSYLAEEDLWQHRQ